MDLPILLPEQLGPYLKAIRLSQGLTQTQLAQRLGLSQTRIVEIEKAPGRIRVEQFLQVLHALQTRLVLQDPRPKPPPQSISTMGYESSQPGSAHVSESHPSLPGATDDVGAPFLTNKGDW